MITSVLKVLVLGAMAVLLAWGWVLVKKSPPGRLLDREIGELARAYRGLGGGGEFPLRARQAASLPDRFFPRLLPPVLKNRLRESAAVTGLHLAIFLQTFPVTFLLFTSGITLGLARREASRHGLSFASPTRAWLGKHLAVLAAAGLLLFATSPVFLPYSSLWIASAALAAGGFLYVSNLPVKL